MSKTHKTSSGTRIVVYENGNVIVTPYNAHTAISMSETEFRELVAYGQAYYELKDQGAFK